MPAVGEHRSGERPTTQERPAPLGDLVGKGWVTGFRIARLIGVGGMGEVWAATSEDMPGQQLAVKVISPEYATHRDALERFFGEARAASALDDPNVIKIFDTGRLDDRRPALIMEYIDGPSLQAMVERTGPLPIDSLGQILIQVASALRAAHAKSITHRDIKPSNILVTSRWGRASFAVVVDFGIAKLHDPQLAGKIRTRTKTFIGTPGFASPEQALGRPVDSKADIYALGVVAYYALTGRLPYPNDSELGMLKLQVDGAPFPDVVELRPDVPPAWNAVIRAALDVDRARRPHAVDFAQRIAAGMANGKSLLRSLAPFVALDRGPSAIAAVTLSADVPTALSQLGTGPISMPATHGRLSRASLALALAGVAVGSLATLAAVQLSSGADRTYAEVADASSIGGPLVPMGAAPPAPDAGFVVRVDAAAGADAGLAVTATRDAGAIFDASGDRAIVVVAPQVDAGVKVAPPPVRPIERGELVIAIDPFAEVWIDGGPVGPTPIRRLLPVGRHRVVLINKDKGKRESVDVTITAANRTVIEETW